MSSESKYPWPASAITPDDMHRLYLLRESAPGTPISKLIARAVRLECDRTLPVLSRTPEPRKEVRPCA